MPGAETSMGGPLSRGRRFVFSLAVAGLALTALWQAPNPLCLFGWILALLAASSWSDERDRKPAEPQIRQAHPPPLWAEEAHEALRKAEGMFSSFVESLPHYIFRKDNDGRFIFVNDRYCRFLGRPASEILGKTETDIFPKELAAKYRRDDMLVRDSESNLDTVETVEAADGTKQYMHLVKSPIYDSRGRVIGIQGVFWDVTERKRAEERLAEEKERLAVTLRSIGDGVISTDTEGRVRLLNSVAEEITGWTQGEAVGKSITEIFRCLDHKSRQPIPCRIEAALQSGRRQETTHRALLVSRCGKEYLIEDRAAAVRDRQRQVIGAVLVFQDVSGRAALEAEAAKSSRIESIGLLAGGIAHDFNNILTAVLGNLSLARLVEGAPVELSRRLEVVERAALRARDLTQQLLTFAKGGAPVKQTASLIELIRESTDFALRGSNVLSEFELASDLAPVEIDPGQIHQVIHNLALNAVQAMPDGGEIHITARNERIAAPSELPLRPGDYVVVSVGDTGPGIHPEFLPKIFDPYFTTKPGGNGLGLATAFSILKRHDGYLTVESALGRGTTFHLYLPASRKLVSNRIDIGPTDCHGAGRILVMDDEETVREVACSMLRHFGYEPEAVRDGTEAVTKYASARKSGEPYRAVLMDLTIPGGMGGKEALQQLRAIDCDIRAIVSSGYSNDPVMSSHREHGFCGVIEKPYRVEEFGRVLRQVVEPKPGAPN